MLIGYARVSTQDQNLDLQTQALTQTGYQKIFEDKISGSRVPNSQGLQKHWECCGRVIPSSLGSLIDLDAVPKT
jgi:hypothetical protein